MINKYKEMAERCLNIGDKIKITYSDELGLIGKEGIVTHIDDIGQIHGTWSGLAISLEYGDNFTVLERNENCGN